MDKFKKPESRLGVKLLVRSTPCPPRLQVFTDLPKQNYARANYRETT